MLEQLIDGVLTTLRISALSRSLELLQLMARRLYVSRRGLQIIREVDLQIMSKRKILHRRRIRLLKRVRRKNRLGRPVVTDLSMERGTSAPSMVRTLIVMGS